MNATIAGIHPPKSREAGLCQRPGALAVFQRAELCKDGAAGLRDDRLVRRDRKTTWSVEDRIPTRSVGTRKTCGGTADLRRPRGRGQLRHEERRPDAVGGAVAGDDAADGESPLGRRATKLPLVPAGEVRGEEFGLRSESIVESASKVAGYVNDPAVGLFSDGQGKGYEALATDVARVIRP